MSSQSSSLQIAGLILAGGRNTRMGGMDKSRIPVNGAPLIHSIARLLQSLFPEVILVSNRPELQGDLPGRVVIASDLYKGRGPLGGLHSGLIHATAQAVFCVACDMPSLNRELIERQIDEFHAAVAGGYEILIPRIGELIEPLHGIYLKKLEPLVGKICSGEGQYSIRVLLGQARTCYWDLEDRPHLRSAFFNLNTPKDLKTHLRSARSGR